SGGAARALDGAAELAAMVRAGEGLLDVCAGGGVRPVDIPDLVRATGLSDVHLSARRRPGAPVEPDAPSTDTDPAIAAAAVDAAGALRTSPRHPANGGRTTPRRRRARRAGACRRGPSRCHRPTPRTQRRVRPLPRPAGTPPRPTGSPPCTPAAAVPPPSSPGSC